MPFLRSASKSRGQCFRTVGSHVGCSSSAVVLCSSHLRSMRVRLSSREVFQRRPPSTTSPWSWGRDVVARRKCSSIVLSSTPRMHVERISCGGVAIYGCMCSSISRSWTPGCPSSSLMASARKILTWPALVQPSICLVKTLKDIIKLYHLLGLMGPPQRFLS